MILVLARHPPVPIDSTNTLTPVTSPTENYTLDEKPQLQELQLRTMTFPAPQHTRAQRSRLPVGSIVGLRYERIPSIAYLSSDLNTRIDDKLSPSRRVRGTIPFELRSH